MLHVKCKMLNVKRGFTIVELLVFMGLFTILIVVLTEILTSVLEQQLRTEAVANVEQDGRYLLERLTYDINRATAITTPGNPGTTSPTLQITIGGVPYLYSVNGSTKNLELKVNNGTPDILNGYDTTIAIANSGFLRIGKGLYNKDSVQLTFTLTGKTVPQSGPQVKTYTTTAALRCETQADATVKCN